jgi:uncharacterized NAD-dependent epimerase/dehydratase family protein
VFLANANMRHPCKFVGIAINSRNLAPKEAIEEIARVEQTYGLPACDVYRTNADKLVDACIAARAEVVAK